LASTEDDEAFEHIVNHQLGNLPAKALLHHSAKLLMLLGAGVLAWLVRFGWAVYGFLSCGGLTAPLITIAGLMVWVWCLNCRIDSWEASEQLVFSPDRLLQTNRSRWHRLWLLPPAGFAAWAGFGVAQLAPSLVGAAVGAIMFVPSVFAGLVARPLLSRTLLPVMQLKTSGPKDTPEI
jgi:hypothetical protein